MMVYIEIEMLGKAKTEEENIIREKRAAFYERLGFRKMNLDIKLFQNLFSTYILECKPNSDTEEEKIKDIFRIYEATLGKLGTKIHCKILNK